jgi:hypothetical protein
MGTRRNELLMANNYLEYSVEIPFAAGKEKECKNWWKQILDDLGVIPGSLDPDKGGQPVLLTEEEIEEHFYGIGVFDLTYSPTAICIYSEESGNIEGLSDLVRMYMQAFNMNGYLRLEYAETCSKPRAGEFGGGVCCVTKNNVYWMNTGSWLPKELRMIEYAPATE